ncbi:MAG: hypothetical protein C5B50_28480 [Verrucomicrobia bacterium]|nr:MAG: hypothetical protein C5B50_28480 [Verrucomicrobiota bacterium]
MVFYTTDVTFYRTSRSQRQAAKAAVAGLMLLLWTVLLALAVSPQLHRLLHQDASNGNHQCLVTQLQRFSLLAGAAPVEAPIAPSGEFQSAPAQDCHFLPSADYRISPSRAPPGGSSSSTVAG